MCWASIRGSETQQRETHLNGRSIPLVFSPVNKNERQQIRFVECFYDRSTVGPLRCAHPFIVVTFSLFKTEAVFKGASGQEGSSILGTHCTSTSKIASSTRFETLGFNVRSPSDRLLIEIQEFGPCEPVILGALRNQPSALH